jgi:hypothetical protein
LLVFNSFNKVKNLMHSFISVNYNKLYLALFMVVMNICFKVNHIDI